MDGLAEFMQRHPGVEVEPEASDREVDLIERRLDVAIRIRQMRDSELVARKLGELRIVVFGAPAYPRGAAVRNIPTSWCATNACSGVPQAALSPGSSGSSGRAKSVSVNGRFRTDSAAATHAAVARGLGIGRTPLWQIHELLDDGLVEVITEEFEAPRTPIQAVWSKARTTPAKTRLFVELLAERLKGERL